MRQGKKTILLLTLLIIACSLAYFFLFLRPTETETKEVLFEEGELEAVDEIAVAGPELDSYRIWRDEDTYDLDEDTKIEISEAYLEAVWQKLTSMESAYKVETAGSISEMGFEEPFVTISYSRENVVLAVLEVGRYSTARDGYYVKRREENSDIYLVDSERITEIMEARQEFYRKNLIDFSSEDDFDRLSSVEVVGKKDDFLTVKFEADDTWFHMSAPIRYICDYKILKSKFLDPVVHLKGTKYVSDEIDAAMGFDDPEYIIAYIYDGEEKKVLVGNRNGSDGMTYICRTDKNLVFLIRDEDLDFLRADYREFIGDSCYSRYINFVESFQIEYQGITEEFILKNAEDYSDKWLAVHKGREYAYEEFIGLYSAVMGVPRNETVEGEEEETDPYARVRVQVKLKSGASDLVEFQKISGREYQVIVNGECHFTALAAGVEQILSSLEQLSSAVW